MKKVLDLIKEKRLFFDGGMGTMLQSMGLKPGEKPELWNIEKPETIESIHREYFNAGANIVKTNTFGINKEKFSNYNELIKAGIECAVRARDGQSDRFIAFDMGPTGRMIKPFGDMEFEECVELYADNVRAMEKCGADLILIETMNDALETKAAVIAAKENSNLPIFVTNVYDEGGKLMTGATPAAMIAMLEGLGVSAIGVNCSLGPDKMEAIISEFTRLSSVPVIANPNAGLPVVYEGRTVYTLNETQFADSMVNLCKKGVTIAGGCCGTTPEYIEALKNAVKDVEYKLPCTKTETLVSSYTHAVQIGKSPVLIGERINPTGKKKLKEAIRTGNMDYLLSEGIRQAEKGVDVLDVNVGVPGIDEPEVMRKTIISLQAVTDKPLQIDSSDSDALEAAMRIYAGKPMVNSVSGKEESINSVLPLVKKYGGVVIALTLDENGIPNTSDGRVNIAEKIIERAGEYGIAVKDIIVDPLALTVSSDSKSAFVTLETIEKLERMGINTSLGVSNVSFGLPQRDIINSMFFIEALQKGLKCAIMNPFSEAMLNAYYAYKVLSGNDEGCKEYISYASDIIPSVPQIFDSTASLKDAVIKGLKEAALSCTMSMLDHNEPLDIINTMIIPALNEVGKDYENGKLFLPQLLMSAEAASGAFELIKTKINKKLSEDEKKIILATVKGDIHDIGKNIVKVVLESYGFSVVDLGKDVEPEAICECIEKTGCTLVGLSALMTTTVPAMEQTIALIAEKYPHVKVMVGGAVLTKEYAEVIGAHYYCGDAMEGVKIAQKVLGQGVEK